MRNAMIRKRHLLLLLFLSSFFLSCEDKMDEHYEKPAWLKGTAFGKFFLPMNTEVNILCFWRLRNYLVFVLYLMGKV